MSETIHLELDGEETVALTMALLACIMSFASMPQTSERDRQIETLRGIAAKAQPQAAACARREQAMQRAGLLNVTLLEESETKP